MKNFKKSISLLLAVLMVAVTFVAMPIASTSDAESVGIVAQAATVKISKTSATLVKGQTLTLKISGTSSKVTWSTSKSSVATVSSSGKITAKAKGTATITAKVNSKKYTCKITVETPKISKTSITLVETNTATLKVSDTAQKITWSSSDKKVATVSSAGKVTAVKKGSATITAKLACGKAYTCKVTVTELTASIKKVAIKEYNTGKGVVEVLTNNNPMAVEIYAKIAYYDKSGKVISTTTDSNYYLQSGRTAVLEFDGPREPSYPYTDISYAKYKVTYEIKSASIKYYYMNAGGISVSASKNKYGNSLLIKSTNNTEYTLDSVGVSVVFFDKDGACIGFDRFFPDCKKAKGFVAYNEISYPKNSAGKYITPASYKVYVDKAYAYKSTIKKNSVLNTSDISAKEYRTEDKVVSVIKNNSTSLVAVYATIIYYDAQNKVIDIKDGDVRFLKSKKSCALMFNLPYDSALNRVEYDYYKIVYNVLKSDTSYYKDGSGNLSINANKSDATGKLICEISNTGTKTLSSVLVDVLLFDGSGNCIKSYSIYANDCRNSGTTAYVNVAYPYVSGTGYVSPASYKIFIHEAVYH